MKLDVMDVILAVAFVLIGLIITGIVCSATTRYNIREEARSIGVGEYYLDDDQMKQFRFIKCDRPHREDE